MIRLYSPRAWLALLSLLACIPAAHAKRPPHAPRAAQVAPPPDEADRASWTQESGLASYYGPAHQGRRTAAGTRFEQKALTAAHPWLPFGTRVRVTVEGTGRSVIVVITDRLYSSRRIVDLSLAAAQTLGMIRQGVATVSLSPA